MSFTEKYIPSADELAASVFPEQVAAHDLGEDVIETPVDLDTFFHTLFFSPLAF